MNMQHQSTLKANMVQEVAVISGASGFIGTHLAKRLVLQDIKIIAIPREVFSDIHLLTRFLKYIQPDYIFHLAAYGNHSSQTNNAEMVNVNYAGTYSMLTATMDIPYKAFINVSSSSVLLSHETFYSATKAGAERLCKAFANEYGKPIVNVRPYSIYGIGEADFRFIPTVFRLCLTGDILKLSPEAVHDWLYVDSFVEGMIRFATWNEYRRKAQGRSFNFGTGTGTSNLGVVRMIEKITGKKAKIELHPDMRKFDAKDWVCDPDGKETYHWEDEYIPTLEEGLRKVYESITKNN
jgi:nucleoside-diphosphate-sugar epimerase